MLLGFKNNLAELIQSRYTQFTSAVSTRAQMVLLLPGEAAPQPGRLEQTVEHIWHIQNCITQNNAFHLNLNLRFLQGQFAAPAAPALELDARREAMLLRSIRLEAQGARVIPAPPPPARAQGETAAGKPSPTLDKAAIPPSWPLSAAKTESLIPLLEQLLRQRDIRQILTESPPILHPRPLGQPEEFPTVHPPDGLAPSSRTDQGRRSAEQPSFQRDGMPLTHRALPVEMPPEGSHSQPEKERKSAFPARIEHPIPAEPKQTSAAAESSRWEDVHRREKRRIRPPSALPRGDRLSPPTPGEHHASSSARRADPFPPEPPAATIRYRKQMGRFRPPESASSQSRPESGGTLGRPSSVAWPMGTDSPAGNAPSVVTEAPPKFSRATRVYEPINPNALAELHTPAETIPAPPSISTQAHTLAETIPAPPAISTKAHTPAESIPAPPSISTKAHTPAATIPAPPAILTKAHTPAESIPAPPSISTKAHTPAETVPAPPAILTKAHTPAATVPAPPAISTKAHTPAETRLVQSRPSFLKAQAPRLLDPQLSRSVASSRLMGGAGDRMRRAEHLPSGRSGAFDGAAPILAGRSPIAPSSLRHLPSNGIEGARTAADSMAIPGGGYSPAPVLYRREPVSRPEEDAAPLDRELPQIQRITRKKTTEEHTAAQGEIRRTLSADTDWPAGGALDPNAVLQAVEQAMGRVDLSKMTDRVYREISNRLRSERKKRGM